MIFIAAPKPPMFFSCLGHDTDARSTNDHLGAGFREFLVHGVRLRTSRAQGGEAEVSLTMRGGRLAATAVISAGALATMMPPASADAGWGQRNGDPGNWGNVIKDAGCAQANAWIVGVRGVLGVIN